MIHSAGCWGAHRKLAEYRFLVGHRLGEEKAGAVFQRETKRLEDDALAEAKKCPHCLWVFGGKKKS